MCQICRIGGTHIHVVDGELVKNGVVVDKEVVPISMSSRVYLHTVFNLHRCCTGSPRHVQRKVHTTCRQLLQACSARCLQWATRMPTRSPSPLPTRSMLSSSSSCCKHLACHTASLQPTPTYHGLQVRLTFCITLHLRDLSIGMVGVPTTPANVHLPRCRTFNTT